ncbi:glycogen/starch synthase [Candidatus Auribacterota bacterium]
MVDLIIDRIVALGINQEDLGVVGVSWAGPGDYENGRVMGTNIEGFNPEDLGEKMVTAGGFPLAEELKKRLQIRGYNLDIEILHDGAAAAKGEANLRGIKGKVVYQAGKVKQKIGEQGHFIVGVVSKTEDGSKVTFQNRATEDGSFPEINSNTGDFYVEHLLSGPSVARRFVEQTVSRLGKRDAAKWLGIKQIDDLLQAVTLDYLTDAYHPSMRVNNKDLVLKIQQVIAAKLEQNDDFAIAFAQQIATETGQFLKVILDTYPKGYYIANILGTGIGSGFLKLDDSSQDTRIVLVGGYAENFYKPKSGEADLFIEDIRKAAGLDKNSNRIERSNFTGARDLEAFRSEIKIYHRGTIGGKKLSLSNVVDFVKKAVQLIAKSGGVKKKEGFFFVNDEGKVEKLKKEDPDVEQYLPSFPLKEATDENGRQIPLWAMQQLTGSIFIGKEVISKEGLVKELDKVLKAYRMIDHDSEIDAKLVDRLLKELLEKGLIIGNSKEGYRSNVTKEFLLVWSDDYTSIREEIESKIDSNEDLTELMTNFASACSAMEKYPTEANHPVLRAVATLDKNKLSKLLNFIRAQKDSNPDLFKTALLDGILLMLDDELKKAFAKLDEEIKEDWEKLPAKFGASEEKSWLEQVRQKNIAVIESVLGVNWIDLHASHVKGTIYEVSPEGQDVAGGLGRVQQYHPVGMTRLGADIAYVEPYYRYSKLHNEEDTNYGPGGNVAVPVKNIKKYKTFSLDLSGREVEVNVYKGINNRGIPVFLIRDKHNRYIRTLYKTDKDGEPSQLEFCEFFTKAAWKFIEIEEKSKKDISGGKRKKAIINCNDAQSLLLPVWRTIEILEISEMLKSGKDKKGKILSAKSKGRLKDRLEHLTKLVTLATTHTYRNRGFIGTYNDYWKNLFIQMGIPEEMHWLFIAKGTDGEMNLTSVGLRCSEITKAVASIHAYEVQEYDPNIDLYGIANGDDILVSTETLQEIVKEIGEEKDLFDLQVDDILKIKRVAKEKVKDKQIEKLTSELEVFRAKVEQAKIRLKKNYMGDASFLNWLKSNQAWDKKLIETVERIPYLENLFQAVKELDSNQKIFSYMGRWVPEKAGMEDTWTENNLRALLREGVQVVIYGNVQPYAASEDIGNSMKYLMDKLNKEARDQGLKGRLIFKDKFSLEEHIDLLPAVDMQANVSDRRTGACEITETNAMANYAIQFSPPYIEGLIAKQGAPINYETGEGNTVIPKNNSPESYLQAMLRIAAMNEKELAIYQANSAKLAQVLEARLTAAAYLRLINKKIVDSEKWLERFLNNVKRPPHEVDLSQVQVEVKAGKENGVYNVGQTFNTLVGDNLVVRYFVDLKGVSQEMVLASMILPNGQKVDMNLVAKDKQIAVFEGVANTEFEGKIQFSLSSGITEVSHDRGIWVSKDVTLNRYNDHKTFDYEIIQSVDGSKTILFKISQADLSQDVVLHYGIPALNQAWDKKALKFKEGFLQGEIRVKDDVDKIAFVLEDVRSKQDKKWDNNNGANYFISLDREKRTIPFSSAALDDVRRLYDQTIAKAA